MRARPCLRGGSLVGDDLVDHDGGRCRSGAHNRSRHAGENFPLESVRLLEAGPFSAAVKANRDYVLALEPDRLLAPFRREAGLPPKAQPYGNWESGGLDGHTAGHYLSALANMIASGEDTPDAQLRRRLDHMIDELQACPKAFGGGYVGGVPGSRALWTAIAGGDIQAINKKWVPWYNVHKTFAGLRDAYLEAGSTKGARRAGALGRLVREPHVPFER